MASERGQGVVLVSSEPQLFVVDVPASCGFYRDRLGFAIELTYGEPPFFALVRRDNARLALRRLCEPVFVGDIREREQLLSGSVSIGSAAEVRQLCAEYHATGVPFQQQLERQPWGALNFVVRDPDGNLVLFAGPAD